MTSLRLLTTTAIFASALALSAPVQAQEQQGWVQNMKTKVTSYFDKEETETSSNVQTNAEVEAYLNEVTVAVPQEITADEAAQIQPAAGGDLDYSEIQNFRDESQTLNTDYDFGNTVNAFNDPMTAEQFNQIETAAGDASEVNDESIVVADDAEEITDESVVVAEDGNASVDAQATTTTMTTTTTEINGVVTDIEENTMTMDNEAATAIDEATAAANAKMEASAKEANKAVQEMDKAIEEETSLDMNVENNSDVDADMAVEPETSIDSEVDASSTTVVQ